MSVSSTTPDLTVGMDSTEPHEGLSARSAAGTGELLRFLAPFLAPVRWAVIGSLAFGMAALLAAAVVPLVVEGTLEHGIDSRALGLLGGLMLLDVILTWVAQRCGFVAATSSARALTEHLYETTLESPMVRQVGLRRPSVVSRHTADIDRVEQAVDVTLIEGLPGVMRIVLSLALLYLVEPRAGLVMLVGTIAFLVLNWHIGRGLLQVDHRRLHASSDVGAVVDETITASRTVSGMNLASWMVARLSERASRLHIATLIQKRRAGRLHIAARVVGYLALLGVVLVGLVGGVAGAGAIAAALLYVEAVVRGLEALPPWLRDWRLAVTSKRRIEQITSAAPRVARLDTGAVTSTSVGEGLTFHDLALEPDSLLTMGALGVPSGGLVALVADAGQSTSRLLEVLGGDSDPDAGLVTLDGVDVRHPLVKRRVALLTYDTSLFDTTVRDHLGAAATDISSVAAEAVLAKAGLAHLVDLPGGGLDARLGSHAEVLSVHERQRLLLAMAVVGSADVVLIDSLPVLADVDVALPLLSAMVGDRQRTVVIATRSAELAERCDHVLALYDDGIVVGTHSDLMIQPRYAQIWDRQSAISADTKLLESIPESQRDSMRSRISTEQFPAGETLFREGSPGDQMMYIITGRVAVLAVDAEGRERRVAEIGPGNFCGDVDSPGGRHSNTVRAVSDTLVRTLSVEAWSAGVMGILDADPVERRVVTAVLRSTNAHEAEIVAELSDLPPDAVVETIARLTAAGGLRTNPDGRLSIVARRRSLAGSAALLDRLGGLDD